MLTDTTVYEAWEPSKNKAHESYAGHFRKS